MTQFWIKHYNELTTTEFHDVLELRIRIFILEQNCPYLELDGKDKEAYHVIGRDETGKVIATSRILPPGISYPEVSIGRVATDEKERKKGIGHEMMKVILNFIEHQFGMAPIRISAQSYLLRFYESHGFMSTGKEYLEDDIPHVEMLLQK